VRLRYTLPALADLSAILDYIAVHSPQGARRVQARIQALTDLLLQHPHIGRRTRDPAILLNTLAAITGKKAGSARLAIHGPTRSPHTVA
jgi:plasmid stabilization system protein ParE